MRISTRGVYALEALLALASHTTDERLSIREISSQTGLSDSYLEQIFALLKKSGLLISTRGNRGGYFLSRPAESITVGEVIRAAEGSLRPVTCSREGLSHCDRYEICLTRPVWSAMEQEIDTFLEQLNLKELTASFLSLEAKDHPEFYI